MKHPNLIISVSGYMIGEPQKKFLTALFDDAIVATNKSIADETRGKEELANLVILRHVLRTMRSSIADYSYEDDEDD